MRKKIIIEIEAESFEFSILDLIKIFDYKKLTYIMVKDENIKVEKK